MSNRILPTDVGKRVTLQFHDEAGNRTEAVGHLERVEFDGATAILCIRRKDDSLVRVPANRIRFGKVVAPGR